MEEFNGIVSEEGNQALIPISEVADEIDKLILSFLEEKYESTQSKRTVQTYLDILNSFRLQLQRQGYDLFFEPDGEQFVDRDDVRLFLASQARTFVASSAHAGVAVSVNTRNLRLSTLSSFYEYAQRNVKKLFANPIDLIKRSKSRPYNGASPLAKDDVQIALKEIDTKTVQGKRDYALLHILLNTGHRVHDVQTLQWKHVRVARNNIVTLSFENMKEGKKHSIQLDERVSKLLLDYLKSYYGESLPLLPEHPIWVNLSDIPNKHQKQGNALGYQAIRKICDKHLGTGKVHTTRHTFAALMIEAGATTEELQEALLHSNIAVTQIYAKEISRSKNSHAKDVADLLGL